MVDMKIIPAHSIEARDMADNLLKEWLDKGIPLSASIDITQELTPTIPVIRERMAMAFGWESWSEMIETVSQPHAANYLDDSPDALELVTLKLSNSIGYDYAHGMILIAIQNSGAGYSPEYRRKLAELASPWGQIIERKTVAPGIDEVTTGSHGGLILSESRCLEMPDHLCLGTRFYEEDCEARMVEFAFPDCFTDNLKHALGSISVYSSSSVPFILSEQAQTLLDECSFDTSLFGIKPQPRDKSLNRDLNDSEQKVVEYLAECVRQNRQPIKFPESEYPSLQDWVYCLSKCLTVDGNWPMSSERWKDHFFQY